MKDEAPARKVGGGGGCHSRSPAHSAAITVPEAASPAGRRHPPRRHGGCAAKPGSPRAGRSPAAARRHRDAPTGQGRRGGGWVGKNGLGTGSVKQSSSQAPGFPDTHPPRSLFRCLRVPPLRRNGTVPVTASAGSPL